MDIEAEITFIIESHRKAKDKELFKTRLKQLFLEGEISAKAFQVAKIIYEIKSDPQKNQETRRKPAEEVDPCSRSGSNRSGC